MHIPEPRQLMPRAEVEDKSVLKKSRALKVIEACMAVNNILIILDLELLWYYGRYLYSMM